jgi:hypothetical protein
MALKRSLVLAATATALGVGGMLLPGATAMASTPTQSVTAAAPASTSTTATTGAPAAQPSEYCEWVEYWDGWGNYYYEWTCYY